MLLYLKGRSARTWVVAWLAAVVILLATTANPVVIPVAFLEGQPIRWTPLWEALPSVLGSITGVMIAPQLASWERRGSPTIHLLAALTATTTLVMTSSLPWLTHFFLPPDARWLDITTNVVSVASFGLLATAFLGRLLGGIVATSSYFAFVILSHAAPNIARRLPMSGVIGNLEPHYVFALLLAAAAVAVWGITRGESRLAGRLRRNE